MTSIYISSTYKDLARYREAVASVLRKMKKIVISMEDYTASDERPLDKCLADVAQCDIYIGLFAHRYGFIPPNDNPNGLSITALEYQHACEHKKPCLIFLVDDGIPWPLPDADVFTGEANRGEKIKALREQLTLDHNRSLFRSPEDLAASVSSAVSNLLDNRAGIKGAGEEKKSTFAVPLPREISSDLLLVYLDADSDFVSDLADYLTSRKLRLTLDRRALLASTSDDFERLERSARSCHAAAVLVSDASLRQLEERHPRIASIFRMIEARTENFFAVCLSDEASAKIRTWPLKLIEPVVGWRPRETQAPRSLYDRLEALKLNTGLDSGKHWVGLPVIVVAMTKREAEEIDTNPEIVRERLGSAAYASFIKLKASISAGGTLPTERYGALRYDFVPFAGIHVNIAGLLDTIVERLNEDQPAQLRGRLIKLQHYPIDELIDHGEDVSPIYTQLSSTGCVVIADEYSLFHPDIQEALMSSGLLAHEQVSLVTLSPSNPYSISPFDLMEAELSKRMAAAFNRFATTFDPQCELSVGDEKRLKRWLSSSLPYTIQSLRHPKPNRQNILRFAREQGIDPHPKVGPLLYSEGGPL